MVTTAELQSYVGKDIRDICGNHFDDATLNHCAHFVSHVMGFTFSYNCRNHVGGTKPGANIRVNEIFAQCPKVGKWADADLARTQLIFTTPSSNVNLAAATMGTMAQKHIGIFHLGKVYHYSNGGDKVVVDTPDSFYAKFKAIYPSPLGLYFGWFPGSDLRLNIHASGENASAERKFDLPDPVNGVWKARAVGEADWFIAGREFNKDSYHGLFLRGSEYWGPRYAAADYAAMIGHWSELLEITGACESENYFCLINSYDRAKFTFGFYQLAAHTPRDNLILLFHALARLPQFSGYFPDLVMQGNQLFRKDASGTSTNLEVEFKASNGESQIMNFMNYLNPTRKLIERQEALMAARLMHWAANDPVMREVQVRVAAQILSDKMARRYAPKLNLDGQSDVICAIVADIFHQSRASMAAVKTALASADPETELIALGGKAYPHRVSRLERAINEAKAKGQLGQKRYVRASNNFIPE